MKCRIANEATWVKSPMMEMMYFQLEMVYGKKIAKLQRKLNEKMLKGEYDDEWYALFVKRWGKELADKQRKLIDDGFTETIQVNIPYTKDEFIEGEGEGCQVSVTKETKDQYEKNVNGGTFVGYLENPCWHYKELNLFDKFEFTMRGKNRPVAFYDGVLDKLTAATDEQHQIRVNVSMAGIYTEFEIKEAMWEGH